MDVCDGIIPSIISGILDADIKTLTSLKNITTWTVMETAGHVITSWLEHSAAPHLNFRVTGKVRASYFSDYSRSRVTNLHGSNF